MSKLSDLRYCTELVVLRNFDDIPFDTVDNPQHASLVYQRFCGTLSEKFIEFDLNSLDDEAAYYLISKTSLSLEQLLKNPDIRVFFNSELFVFLNRSEHIEIRLLKKDMDIQAEYSNILQILEGLDKQYPFARSGNQYINSRRELRGTGAFINHFVHLPILQYFNKIGAEQYLKQNIDIRKSSAPDANPICSMIKISTDNCYFDDIEQQSNHVYKYMNEILHKELREQEELKSNSLFSLKDKVNKAFGVAKYALLLDELEFLSLHTFFRTASEFDLIGISSKKIDSIFEKIFSQTYYIDDFESACASRSQLVRKVLVPLLKDTMEE